MKIYAVDFDGTLSLAEWPKIGVPNKKLFDFLRDRKKAGDKIILWTCRDGKQLSEAVSWCWQNGLVFDAVNDNLPENIEKYGGNSRKIFCDFYIDDRAVPASVFGFSQQEEEKSVGKLAV